MRLGYVKDCLLKLGQGVYYDEAIPHPIFEIYCSSSAVKFRYGSCHLTALSPFRGNLFCFSPR